MKLPIIDSSTFSIVLPSTKETIQVRPFLVKEEKMLLMSQESENSEQQMDSVAQIVRNCTFNAVEPTIAAYFDVEYLLLQIRSKSVGEIVNPTYKCRSKIDDDIQECGHLTNITINLSDIPPTDVNKDPSKFLIKLNNRYTLKLRYPTIYTVNELLAASIKKNIPTAEKTINAIVGLFDQLIDNENDSSYSFDQYSRDEKINFMDQLKPQDFNFIIEFLEYMPTVSYKTEYTCEKCGTLHKIHLQGLIDFLA